MNKIKNVLAAVLVLVIVSAGTAESAGLSAGLGNRLIKIGHMLIYMGKALGGTDDTSISKETQEEDEAIATAEEKLSQLKEENGGSLNALVEVVIILPETYRSELTPQRESVWKKSGSALFGSEAIKFESSKPSLCVNEQIFITEFTRWLEQKAPIDNLMITDEKVYWEVNDIPSPQKEFIQSLKQKVIEIIEANKADNSGTNVDETDLQKKLVSHLQAKIDSNDSFFYAFVFKETEALYKILIDDRPRDSYTQFTERYYLKPDWLPVDPRGINRFVDNYVEGANLETRVEIFYENSFSLNENSSCEMVYEKFAERMLDYAKSN